MRDSSLNLSLPWWKSEKKNLVQGGDKQELVSALVKVWKYFVDSRQEGLQPEFVSAVLKVWNYSVQVGSQTRIGFCLGESLKTLCGLNRTGIPAWICFCLGEKKWKLSVDSTEQRIQPELVSALVNVWKHFVDSIEQKKPWRWASENVTYESPKIHAPSKT